MFSHSSGSRAALSGRPTTANTLNFPSLEPLQLQPRPVNAALSTNDPRPTNKMDEYEALLHAMRAAKEMNIIHLRCYDDSDLVAGQVAGTCDAVSPTMATYR